VNIRHINTGPRDSNAAQMLGISLFLTSTLIVASKRVDWFKRVWWMMEETCQDCNAELYAVL
jgi:hypothetical protein